MKKPYYQDDAVTLYHGDCMEIMPQIAAGSIDAVICDPPYGTVSCAWDVVIPFDEMWKFLNGVTTSTAATVLFCAEPFTSNLIVSNLKVFKYRLTWDKVSSGNFLNAKKQPLRQVEDIAVFYESQPTYNPKMETRGKPRNKGGYNKVGRDSPYSFSENSNETKVNDVYYPSDLLVYSNAVKAGKQHPTQKPIALMAYLISTYTNAGDTVLDFTCGSGTTGRAAKDLGRKCVMIEREEKYCEIAANRMKQEVLGIW